MIAFGGLAIVAAAALAAPLVLGLFPRIRLPAIVLEIVLGIVIGPHVLGLGFDRHADPGHEPYWGSRFYFCSQVSLSSISAPSGQRSREAAVAHRVEWLACLKREAPAGGDCEEGNVNSWDLNALELKPRLPEILSTSEAARAIVLDLADGERLRDHELHERAWLVVLDGQVEVATSAGERATGGIGLLVEVAPGERHEVVARSKSRLLLLLTPWPGSGHPGAMTIREKLYTRRHAAKRAMREFGESRRQDEA